MVLGPGLREGWGETIVDCHGYRIDCGACELEDVVADMRFEWKTRDDQVSEIGNRFKDLSLDKHHRSPLWQVIVEFMCRKSESPYPGIRAESIFDVGHRVENRWQVLNIYSRHDEIEADHRRVVCYREPQSRRCTCNI